MKLSCYFVKLSRNICNIRNVFFLPNFVLLNTFQLKLPNWLVLHISWMTYSLPHHSPAIGWVQVSSAAPPPDFLFAHLNTPPPPSSLTSVALSRPIFCPCVWSERLLAAINISFQPFVFMIFVPPFSQHSERPWQPSLDGHRTAETDQWLQPPSAWPRLDERSRGSREAFQNIWCGKAPDLIVSPRTAAAG